MPTPAKFDPGFRLSPLDGWVLLLGAVASLGAAQIALHLGIAVALVVGHFFLFCNVIRIRRAPELVWALAFVCLCSASTFFGVPSWFQSFGLAMALTAVLVAFELRAPSYHGVAWKRVNPTLEQWWQLKRKPLS